MLVEPYHRADIIHLACILFLASGMMLGPGVDVGIQFTGACIHKHTAYSTEVYAVDNWMYFISVGFS